MNKDILKENMLSVFSMGNHMVNELIKDFEPFSLPKHAFLINEGKRIYQNYFLEKGYIHSFTLDKDGKEVTTNIFSAPCFVNDFLSFFKQLPAKQSYQTLSECTIWSISYNKVDNFFHSVPEAREFGRALILNQLDAITERMIDMIKYPAEKRYMKLLNNHLGIFQNVPLKIIASYLGITDTSLSRIRKNIARK